MGHTLFLASARVVGAVVGDPYRGFVLLDMLVSAVALVSVWWWLRALVSPAPRRPRRLGSGCGPVFWAYGAMAGNYTAIVLVGSFLLGVAWRTWRRSAAVASLRGGGGPGLGHGLTGRTSARSGCRSCS